MEAGSDGRSDIIAKIGLTGEGINIKVSGRGKKLFEDEMIESTQKVLDELGIKNARVELQDNGALDYCIRARVKAAALKALEGR